MGRVPVEAKATAPVDSSLQRMGATKGQSQQGWIANLALVVERLKILVDSQTYGRGEAVAPGVESQGQAKNLEELAMVARGVREEFIHEKEYTLGLVNCKQLF